MADRCHLCGYRLDGLPDKHNCPECGFAYDRSAEVVAQAAFGAWAYLLVGVSGLMAVCFHAFAVRLKPWWAIGPVFVVVSTFVGFVLYGWRCLQRPNRAILSRDGLALVGSFTALNWSARETKQLTWTEIGSVRLRRLSSNVEIYDPQGTLALQLATDFFGTRARAQRFVERANVWLANLHADVARRESEPRL